MVIRLPLSSQNHQRHYLQMPQHQPPGFMQLLVRGQRQFRPRTLPDPVLQELRDVLERPLGLHLTQEKRLHRERADRVRALELWQQRQSRCQEKTTRNQTRTTTTRTTLECDTTCGHPLTIDATGHPKSRCRRRQRPRQCPLHIPLA